MILAPSRAEGRRVQPLRAVTAVIALYAFVLHAVLGGLVPSTQPVGHGVLCLGQYDGDGAAASGAGTPDSGHHAHPPCCTVPGSVLLGLLPEPATRIVAWPSREAVRLAWRPEALVSARGPPGTIAHPRGPPVV